MSRKLVSLVSLSILMGMLSVALKVQMVRSGGTIYIRADGSIDPPTAPIQRDGSLYTFTDNVNDSIVVERSNIVIDGEGYMIQGNGSYSGFFLSAISNVTIKNTNINGFYYGLCLNSTSHSVISGNTITNNSWGIHLKTYSNCNVVIANEISSNNDRGIFILRSYNNTISQNNVRSNDRHGIVISDSSGNIVYSNKIMANYDTGINIWTYLKASSHNIIDANNITMNQNGLDLSRSPNNTISRNNIANNKFSGIRFGHSSDNKIHYNNFINNTHQAWIYTFGTFGIATNIWDKGFPFGGNYWSDHARNDTYSGSHQNIIDSDGISDTPYIIDAYNQDTYPLMGMFSDFNATLEYHVTAICNSAISDFQFNGTAIIFNVTGEDGTAGFCRICIPTALMNDAYKVFVNGTEVPRSLLQCSNSTHRYLYFTYNHSTQKAVITSFVQPPPWNLIAWAGVAVLALGSSFFGYLYLKTRLELKKVHGKIAKISERKSANICPNCGVQNKPEAKFCRKCGKSL